MSDWRKQSNPQTTLPTEERQFTRFSLQIKLIIIFLLIALIPLGLLTLIYNVEQQLRTVSLLTVVTVTITVVVIVAIVVSRQIFRPIIDLTAAARRAIAGDLSVEVEVNSWDEVEQLAAVFNQMTAQLRHAIGSLESQIEARTNDLVLSMEVGQRAASIRDLQTLLPKITEFIRTQFDLYYVHVYLVDDTGQLLVMRAGTGRVGQLLLERGHSLPVGPGSIVGRVAADGESIVVPDTSLSSLHRPNDLLPETRSELAVPLKVEGRVLGVLDMQSDRVNMFTENNRTVFEAMATQLAIAIDGAQQWSAAQESQRRLETALNQLTHEAWVNKLGQRAEGVGFSYDLAAIKPVGTEAKNDTPRIPLVVQNEKIGHLSVKTPHNRALSPDEQKLLAAVAQQLAQKAENIRLFEETQRQAAREQMARQITDRIRASRDIETALKTAAEELSKALGTAKTIIDLQVTPEAEQMIEPFVSENVKQDDSHE